LRVDSIRLPSGEWLANYGIVRCVDGDEPATGSSHSARSLAMSTKQNNSTVSEMLTKRIGGIKKYLTDPNTVIPIAGKQCHPSDVLALFQGDVDARAAVDTAHAGVTSAIAGRKTADANRRDADSALKTFIVHLYGATSVQAQEFGYPPPKPRSTTVAAKAAAIQKGAATREARGTKGSVQKAEITGTMLVFSSPEAAAAAAKHAVGPAAGAPVVTGGNPIVTGSTPAAAPTEATQPEATPHAPPAAAPAVSNGSNGAAH
jgi:hypothetical protein